MALKDALVLCYHSLVSEVLTFLYCFAICFSFVRRINLLFCFYFCLELPCFLSAFMSSRFVFPSPCVSFFLCHLYFNSCVCLHNPDRYQFDCKLFYFTELSLLVNCLSHSNMPERSTRRNVLVLVEMLAFFGLTL